MGCCFETYAKGYVIVSANGNKKAPVRGLFVSRFCLRRARLDVRINGDLVARLALVLELHNAVDQRVDREIAAESDVAARVPLRSALADDDVTGDDFLTAELLHAAVLRIAVAPVAR